MEQTISGNNRHMGWSEFENKLLWETADEAQQRGLPLKSVFERIAQQTGRRPNSIRNYYYAQVRQQAGGQERAQRFVPFTQEEVDWLMEQVLRGRAEGQSVRACLQRLSEGDHSRMLRYQNKYRSIIKNRPEYVKSMVERLNGEGVACDAPQVNHRAHANLDEACAELRESGSRAGDAELARALEVLSRRLRAEPGGAGEEGALAGAVQDFLVPVKEFLASDAERRRERLDAFCAELSEKVGALEARLPAECETAYQN